MNIQKVTAQKVRNSFENSEKNTTTVENKPNNPINGFFLERLFDLKKSFYTAVPFPTNKS